jgi:hypothetical protein
MPPLDDEARDMLMEMLRWGVPPALVAAIVVMAVLEWLGGPKQAPAAAALGLVAGVVFGLWSYSAAPLFSTEETSPLLVGLHGALNLVNGDSSWNRMPWAVLAAVCAERLARALESHANDGWLLRGAAAVGIAWWLIPEPARVEFVWLAPSFAAVVFLQWELLSRLAAEPPDGSVPVCLALAFLTAGILLVSVGITRSMEASVLCASALVGVAIVAWWRRADASGAIPAAAVLLPGLLLMGQRETSEPVPWYAFAVAALAPLMLFGAWPVRHWPAVPRHLARLVLVLIPLIAALLLAQQAGPLDLAGAAEEPW